MSAVNKSGNVDSQSKKPTKGKQSQYNKSHSLHKRSPQKFTRSDSAIYVSNKTRIKALLEKCEKLIGSQENELILYCLGAAIQKGINLGLLICDKYPTFSLSVSTYTTELVDDLEPLEDDYDYETQKRQTSAIQIRLFRINPIEPASANVTAS